LFIHERTVKRQFCGLVALCQRLTIDMPARPEMYLQLDSQFLSRKTLISRQTNCCGEHVRFDFDGIAADANAVIAQRHL